jgi:hypothetical protein
MQHSVDLVLINPLHAPQEYNCGEYSSGISINSVDLQRGQVMAE